MRAPLAGDGEEYVLGRHAGAERAGEIIADRLADAEPRLAGGDRVQHVRAADAARRAVEGAGAAGVRIGIHQHSAGQRVGLIGDDRVADALIGPDIVQALDAELTRERAAGLHARGCLRRRRGDEMIEDNHHLGWICDLQHLAPAFRQEGEIDQTRGLDIDDGDVAWRNFRRAAGPCEDLFGNCHAHGVSASQVHCAPPWYSVQGSLSFAVSCPHGFARVNLRIATWNINSLRLRLPLLKELIAALEPDVICLQETKVPDELFPAEGPPKLGLSACTVPRHEGLQRRGDPVATADPAA